MIARVGRAPRDRVRGDRGLTYYDEIKWCKQCKQYVRYLLSLKGSYCVHCGGEVVLFNRQDLKEFKNTLKK